MNYRLVAAARWGTGGLVVLAVVVALVAVWTGDWRWLWTGLIVGVPAALAGLGLLGAAVKRTQP